MAGKDTRGRRDLVKDAWDFRFLAGTLIVSITAILLSLALGVPAPLEAFMLVLP